MRAYACAAFLRGINLGNRRVKMEQLRTIFEEAGYDNVETLIASGNVSFTTKQSPEKAERRIEQVLQKALGYEVDTFLRTADELMGIVRYDPFPGIVRAPDSSIQVVFLRDTVKKDVAEYLESQRTDRDMLHAHEREIYWYNAGRMTDSLLDWKEIGREIGALTTTTRNFNTVVRMAEKLAVQS